MVLCELQRLSEGHDEEGRCFRNVCFACFRRPNQLAIDPCSIHVQSDFVICKEVLAKTLRRNGRENFFQALHVRSIPRTKYKVIFDDFPRHELSGTASPDCRSVGVCLGVNVGI